MSSVAMETGRRSVKLAVLSNPLDILLIYPGKPVESPRSPFTIMVLASWIRKHGYSVRLFDQRVEAIDWDLIGSAKMIGISSMTGMQLGEAVPLAKLIKARYPDTPVIWGGPHVTFFPKQSAAAPYVDYVVEAEGEPVIIELMKKLMAQEAPECVPGVTYQAGDGEIVHNPKPETVDMDTLDLPAYDLVDLARYNDLMNGLSYESSRGCPYPCTFCYVQVFHNREFRGKSPEKVLEEMKLLKQRYGIKRIYFTEDYLWVNKKRALQQFALFVEHGLDLRWEATCRADFLSKVTDGEMEILAKAGAEILSLGLESGSERMLKVVQKHITVEQAKAAIQKCVKYGIMTTSSFIIGMPTETEEDVEASLRMYDTLTSFSDQVEINGLFLYTPYPGVPLYEEAVKCGFKKMETLEEWCRWSYGDASTNVWLAPEWRARLETISHIVRFKYLHHRFEFYSRNSPEFKRQKLSKWWLRMAYDMFMPALAAVADFRWRHRIFAHGYEWKLWKNLTQDLFRIV